ncbi:hypothetical protein LTR56_005713 [Elasticomyces elasticus]|nr:hypothetical protein LTR56_005713 [Elasticomyces elasticus]KAK3657490.1 hypothetical protein LTR22_009356 [Elasticomyces elasticus]KAK4907377.1 hypothetical protein LTR49_023613 [Elasticomyces elasticus]KAK5764975.1 hypothetical protein LTS12_004753 [Elasticomyces elasticus]
MSSAPRRSTRLQAKRPSIGGIDVSLTAPDDNNTHLLRLPRELRDLIYKLVVVPTPAVVLYRVKSFKWHTTDVAEMVEGIKTYVNDYVAMSLVCRQVHDEVSTCFFAEVTFCAWISIPRYFPFANMDKIVRHLKHFVFYRYTASKNGSSVFSTVLDVALKQGHLLTSVTARPLEATTIAELMEALYFDIGAPGAVNESAQYSAEENMQPALQVLKAGVITEGKGKTVQTKVTACPASHDTIPKTINALYFETGVREPIDTHIQREAEERVEPALQALRESVLAEGMLTVKALHDLWEGVCSAW